MLSVEFDYRRIRGESGDQTREFKRRRSFRRWTGRARRRRSYWGWLWLLVLGGLAFGGFRWYQASQQKKAAAEAAQAERAAHRAVSITASAARRADLPVVLRGLGHRHRIQHGQREVARRRSDRSD